MIALAERVATPMLDRLLHIGDYTGAYDGDLLHALQFRAHPSDLEGHAGNGGGVTPMLWEMFDMVKFLEDCERLRMLPE
jgi:hypothetical protein